MSFEKFVGECKKICGEHASLLEKPPHNINADLSLPCFSLAREFKKNPVEISKDFSSKFAHSLSPGSLIEKIEASGPYVNFIADWQKLSNLIAKEISIKKDKYGSSNNKGTVMVEYISPNSNKPLHIGHLRNASVGISISNILEFSGKKVVRAILINDRGVHICKSMLAYKKWGKGTPTSEKKKPDHFIGDYYVLFEKKSKEDPRLLEEVQEMLCQWEKNDPYVKALWKKMNSWALKGMKQTYKNFGAEFDVWFLESDFYYKAMPIIKDGLKKGIFIKDEKGIMVDLEKYGLSKKIVLRADGTSIYLTNDLALTKHKFEHFKLDLAIWVVASEHTLYFKQLFKIFELLGLDYKCCHLSYGLVNLPSGRMKSREGTVIDADNLMDEITDLANKEIKNRYPDITKKELEERANGIALAAIKYYMVKTEPIKDILFISNHAISFEGDTGPYLQYTYARALSILERASSKPSSVRGWEDDEKLLFKKLSMFPRVIEESARDLKPNYLAVYLSKLAAVFNEFYHSKKVVGNEREKELLLLVKCVATVMETGLELLGIKPLKKM